MVLQQRLSIRSMKMKTAKEMFEELGYKQIIDLCEISYEINDYSSGYCDWKRVSFDLKDKTFYADENYEAMCIDAKTFKAIYQQMKELGWLDE